MTCLVCGRPTSPRLEKSYRYTESGLSSVILVNSVTTDVCACGETYTGFRAVGPLHKAISAALIRKRGRLAPEEIRFLRKSLGWSGAAFAKLMGTAHETVSRWEHGTPMGPQADRLLRLLVARESPIRDYPVEVLTQIGNGPTRPVRVELEHGPDGWILRLGPGLIAVVTAARGTKRQKENQRTVTT